MAAPLTEFMSKTKDVYVLSFLAVDVHDCVTFSPSLPFVAATGSKRNKDNFLFTERKNNQDLFRSKKMPLQISMLKKTIGWRIAYDKVFFILPSRKVGTYIVFN